MRSWLYWTSLVLGLVCCSCNGQSGETPSHAVQELIDRSLDWMLENRDSSFHYAQAALDLSRQTRDLAGEECALVLPTMILVNGGENGAMADSVASALLSSSEKSASEYGVARAKSAIGIVAIRKGDFLAGIPLLSEAAEMDRVGGRGLTLINDLTTLGAAFGKFGFLKAELECYNRAWVVCDSLELKNSRPRILANVASCLHDLGYSKQAWQSYHDCIRSCNVDDAEVLADAYTGLSVVYRKQNNHDSANICLKVSDSICRQTGASMGLYRNRVEAAKIDFELNRYQVAIDSLAGMDYWQSGIPDSLVYFEMLQLRGLCYLGVGLADSSTNYFQRYEAFARRIGNLKMIAENYRIRCEVLGKLGFIDSAERYCRLGDEIKDSAEQNHATQLAVVGMDFATSGNKNGVSESNDLIPIFIVLVLMGLILVSVVFWIVSLRRKKFGGMPKSPVIGPGFPAEDVGELEEPLNEKDLSTRKAAPLALERPPIAFEDVICAKSQGHFFMLLYLDVDGNVQSQEVDTRTPRKLSLSMFHKNSGERLLESKRGYLVNPAYIDLSEDNAKIHLLHPEAVALIKANVERRRTKGEGYFEEYPLPITSTPGKNFADRLAAWREKFGQ